MSQSLATQIRQFSIDRKIPVKRIFRDANVSYPTYKLWRKGTNARPVTQQRVLDAMDQLAAANAMPNEIPAPTSQSRKLKPYTHKKLPKEQNPVYAAIKSLAAVAGETGWTGNLTQFQKVLKANSPWIPLPSAPHIFMRRVNSAMLDLSRDGYSLVRKTIGVDGKPTRQFTLTGPTVAVPTVERSPLEELIASKEAALKAMQDRAAEEQAPIQTEIDALRLAHSLLHK